MNGKASSSNKKGKNVYETISRIFVYEISWSRSNVTNKNVILIRAGWVKIKYNKYTENVILIRNKMFITVDFITFEQSTIGQDMRI